MNKRAVLPIAALAIILALILFFATRGRNPGTPSVTPKPAPRTETAGPQTSNPNSGLELKADPIPEPDVPVKGKTPWAKVPSKIKFASGGVFSTKLAKSFGYEYLCLDIMGQSNILGMPREQTLAMGAQVRALEKLDSAILAWAGVPTTRDRWEAFKVDEQVRANLAGKLIEILRSGADTVAEQVAAGLELPFEWTGDALKTRALVLLGELDDPATLSDVRTHLDSKNPEHAAAAAVALTKAGAFSEVAGRIENSGPEVQSAYLAAFKWGLGGSGTIDTGGKEPWGFLTIGPRVPNAGPFLDMVLRLAETTPDSAVRASAFGALALHYEDPRAFDAMRRALMSRDDPEVLGALLWNRQAYFFARDSDTAARLMALSAKDDDRVAVASTHRLCASTDPAVVQFLINQVRSASGAKLNAALSALSVNGHVLREETLKAIESRLPEISDKDMRETASRTIKALRN